MKAKVFGFSIYTLFIFSFGIGASYWYFVGRFDYDVRISKAKISQSTIPKELISVSPPTLLGKNKNTYQTSSKIVIEGVGDFTISQDIDIKKIPTQSLYIRGGVDTIFLKDFDLIPYVGIQYNKNSLSYSVDIGYSPLSQNMKISFSLGVKVF